MRRDRTAAATVRSPATSEGPVAVSFGELVAHPVHGEDVARAARIRLDLPPDVLDVRVDGALEGIDVGAAHRVEQLRAGEDAAWLSRELGEQQKLGRRQIDRRPAA